MVDYRMSRWKRLFLTIWTGQALSLFGSRLVGFSVIWWLTMKTGAASTLALASFMELLPRIVLSTLAGPLVDRWNRRHVMIAADSFVALATGCLALIFWLGAARPGYVFALLLVRSSGDVFHNSAMLASVSLMAPRDQLARIAGLNQTLEGASNIAAPALAAVLVSILPIQIVLAIDVATAAVAVVPLAFILIPQPEKNEAQGKAASFLAALIEGFSHLAGVRGLLFLFIYSSATWMLAAPAWRFLPLLATKHLQGGAVQLGMMSSAFGAGVVAGGAILTVWGGFKRRIVTRWLSAFGSGLAYIALGFAPAGSFALAVAACGSFGITFSLALAAQRALIQTTVPPALQGRIFSIFTFALNVMQPIGLAVFGVFGDLLGPRAPFLIGGATLLFVATMMGLTPALMRMESAAESPPPAPLR